MQVVSIISLSIDEHIIELYFSWRFYSFFLGCLIQINLLLVFSRFFKHVSDDKLTTHLISFYLYGIEYFCKADINFLNPVKIAEPFNLFRTEILFVLLLQSQLGNNFLHFLPSLNIPLIVFDLDSYSKDFLFLTRVQSFEPVLSKPEMLHIVILVSISF